MRYKIATTKINYIISKTYLGNVGDSEERSYSFFLKERFPKYEAYWRYLIVPNTNRIEVEVKDPTERIRARKGVSEDITDIASVHYSMFMNLIYSYDHLRDFRLSSFQYFYLHLVSACDLAEEFLMRTYFLALECSGQRTKFYENYLNKGRTVPWTFPSRARILDEVNNRKVKPSVRVGRKASSLDGGRPRSFQDLAS